MPFAGYNDHDDCVSSNRDKSDPDAYCAEIRRRIEGKAVDVPAERLLNAVATHGDAIAAECVQASRQHPADGSQSNDPTETPSDMTVQKSATATGQFGVASPTVGKSPSGDRVAITNNPIKFDAAGLPKAYQQAVEADNFVIYGKASIEQTDVDGQRITIDALERALERFFDSEDAPGIISFTHDDVPVGRPLREYELDEPTTVDIGGETHTFEAGESLTAAVKDADADGLRELWLPAQLANDTQMHRWIRAKALNGFFDGYSVTVGPHREPQTGPDGVEEIDGVDLYSVTLAESDKIKNPGSEFDVAVVKAGEWIDRAAEAVRTTLTEHMDSSKFLPQILRKAAEDMETDGADDTPPDDAQPGGTDPTDTADTEQKGDYEDEDDDEADEKATDDGGPSPIMAAVEDGKFSAEEGTRVQQLADEYGMAVEPLVDAISDDTMDVDDAAQFLEAMNSAMGSGGEAEKADTEAKASVRDVAGELASAYDIEIDEVMAMLEPVVDGDASPQDVAARIAEEQGAEMDDVLPLVASLDEDSDDPGEMKGETADSPDAADADADPTQKSDPTMSDDTDPSDEVDTEAIAKAVADELDLDSRIEKAVSERLPDDDLVTAKALDERLETSQDDIADAVGAEMQSVLSKADTTTTPSPSTPDEGGATIGDTIKEHF